MNGGLKMTKYFIGYLALITFSAGCVTKGEGNRMKASINALQILVKEIQSGLNQRKVREVEIQRKAERSTRELRKVISQATSVLRRSSADIGVQISNIRSNIQKLTGKTEVLEKDLLALKNKYSTDKKHLDERLHEVSEGKKRICKILIPAVPQEAYALARKQLTESKFGCSLKMFRAFLKDHPRDTRAGHAQYWIGEVFFMQKKNQQAIVEFQRVRELYPKSEKADDALLKLAYCFERIGAYDDAIDFLKLLLRKHRRSPLRKEAKDKIKALRKKRKAR